MTQSRSNGRNLRWRLAVVTGMFAVCTATVVRSRADQTPQTVPAAPPQTAAQDDDELARIGEPLVKKVCDTACHGLEKLDEMRRTRKVGPIR